MQTSNSVAKFLTVLVPVVALAGCASQSEVSELRSDLQQTRAAVEAVAKDAKAARAAAEAAERQAAAAQKAAGDVSTKADRIFRKSLRK